MSRPIVMSQEDIFASSLLTSYLVCRTCSDNGHACLGYTEPAQHQRTRSTDQPSGREDDEESHSSHSRSATRSPSRMRKSDEASQKPGLDQQSSIESSTSLKSASPHRGGMFSIKENDQMSESRSPASSKPASPLHSFCQY